MKILVKKCSITVSMNFLYGYLVSYHVKGDSENSESIDGSMIINHRHLFHYD